MKQLKEKHPILFCVAIEILFLSFLWITGQIISTFTTKWDIYFFRLLKEFLFALFAIFLLYYNKQSYIITRRGKGFKTGLLTGAFLLLIPTLALVICCIIVIFPDLGEIISESNPIVFHLQSPTHIIAFVCFMILVGIAEEFICRGLIAEVLLKHFGTDRSGIIKAVVLSGILFGSAHFLNFRNSGIQSAVVQVVLTGLFGMILAVAYYVSGNIWPVVFIHAYNDFAALAFDGGIFSRAGQDINSSLYGDYTWFNLISAIPYIFVILILLRKKNIKKIQETFGA